MNYKIELAIKHHEKALQVIYFILIRNFIYLYHLSKIIVYNFNKKIEPTISIFNSLEEK